MSEKREFYERQIELIKLGDVEKFIDTQYNDDAVLINLSAEPITITGSKALKEYFKEYIKNISGFELISTDKFVETDDSIFFEATIKTDYIKAVVFDALYMKNGKIFRHYSGLKSIL